MKEFNLIIKAAGATIRLAGFWKLFFGTVLMLAFEYASETQGDAECSGLIFDAGKTTMHFIVSRMSSSILSCRDKSRRWLLGFITCTCASTGSRLNRRPYSITTSTGASPSKCR